jgi:RNA polymerase sigma-32 factor
MAKKKTKKVSKTATAAKKKAKKPVVKKPAAKVAVKKTAAKPVSKAATAKKPAAAKPVRKSSSPANEPKLLQPVKKSSNKEAKAVKAEIVEHTTALAARGSNQLTPVGDSLSSYLAGINKYPLLTREQEGIIAERYYKNKDPKDAEILVTSNLRFVVKVAAEYSKFGNRLIDLIQEGNVGLMHAVKEFNPYKGVRLITYAVWWIRGYIQEYLMRHHSIVRIGTTQNQRKLFYHLQKEKNHLDQIGQESSVKLLSTRLGIPEDDIRMMEERMSGRDVSLDAPVSEDGTSHRLDLESTGEELVDQKLEKLENLSLLQGKIASLRPNLNPKELYLLEERLLADQPITLQEIGDKWGVTREAVRQMESRLMKKLKDEMQKAE